MAVSKASASLQGGNTPALLADAIEKIILKHFNSSLQKHVTKLLNDFRHDNINSLNIHLDAELKAKYETFTHQEYSVKEVSRSPEGILEHIGALFGTKYTKIKTITHTVENKIIVGDNSSEIIENILNNLEQELQPIASAILNNIAQNYFEKEKEIVTGIIQKLENAEKLLLQEMM